MTPVEVKESWLTRVWLGNVSPAFRSYLTDQISSNTGALLSAIATIIVAFVLVLALNEYTDKGGLTVWFATLLAITIAAFFYNFINRHRPLVQVIVGVTTFETIIGLLWVVPGVYFFPVYPSNLQIFVALLLVGVAISNAIARHMVLPAAIAAIGVSLPVTASLQLFDISRQSIQLFLLMMTGWVCALGLTFVLRANHIGRLMLLHEKHTLMQSVEDKIIELDKLRDLEAQSRKEAEAANAAKSRFLAHSSHDLRQPLHAINLLLETIPEDGLNAQSQKVMERVRYSLDSLTSLFDSLLDIAQLDTGQVRVESTVFPVASLFDQIISEFSELARSNDVFIRCPVSTIVLDSDPIILKRMVQNLVSNAIHHAEGKEVLLGVRRNGTTVSIEVYDTGKGIPTRYQERIFQEFSRLPDASKTENSPGLGLGLAIVQKLSRVLNVRLSIDSQPGSGSVFRIRNIPRAALSNQGRNPSLTMNPFVHAGQGRVAIIDDDTEILEATNEIIKKWGFTADTYTEYIADEFIQPDIILCDFELAGSANGIDTIRSIRQSSQREIPAILITGNSSSAVGEAAKKAGLLVLYKPVRPAQLRSVLLAASVGVESSGKLD